MKIALNINNQIEFYMLKTGKVSLDIIQFSEPFCSIGFPSNSDDYLKEEDQKHWHLPERC